MSCSPFDLKDYFLKELPDAGRQPVEDHLRTCPACREELDRLRLTEAALFALRDEEVPQRIGFVSDEVFEPAPWRRWWGAFWGSAARLGFASAAMLSIAILVHAFVRPAPLAPLVSSPVATAASISPVEVQNLIQAAVSRSVKESEARQEEKTQKLVADSLYREEQERIMRVRAEDLNRYLERSDGARKVAAYRTTAETRLLP
ncbi:MAG: zf-HC2 domain-containing protein [Bryobacteraceae bacterium]|jgi:anti-sigma factor RsiW